MIPVIDLFAGPGGLGEGFSSLRDGNGFRVFKTIMSIEKDQGARETLRMRAYFRRLFDSQGDIPSPYLSYIRNPTPENKERVKAVDKPAWDEAGEEALLAELKVDDDSLVDKAESRLQKFPHDKLVLIGGPPCQAYSLVGRARRTNDKERLQADTKQTLYKCYLRFIERLKPDIFVMENVKGILSAKHYGMGVFGHIVQDMKELGYSVKSLVVDNPGAPSDYVVRAEQYGIPQARHRVILLGVRKGSGVKPSILVPQPIVSAGEALAGLPMLRSGISQRSDQLDSEWESVVRAAARRLSSTEEGKPLRQPLEQVIAGYLPRKVEAHTLVRGHSIPYENWYRGRLGTSRIVTNHHSRSHLAADLERYLFYASYAEINGVSPTLYDVPKYLIPNHANAQGLLRGDSIEFPDRFNVQVKGKPSTTVTSHIMKDGHYYIHFDPRQCRSLTVREAARLQTFPDDYFFEGNRTSQYQQVGNAVPPLLAKRIAEIVFEALE